MSRTGRLVILILSFFAASSLSGQVVFSRRVYREQGRSFQQIWTWNPANGALTALTQSPRNHYLPACTGSEITFVSPQKYEEGSKLWSFDRKSGEEREIGPAPAPPDRKPPADGCDASAKAGTLEACGKEEDLFLSREGKPIGEFHIPANECVIDGRGTLGPCPTPIESLEWSPDSKWLLVEERGLHTNSTSPQSDYYVVDPVTMKLSKAASAVSALWLPGRDVLLYTAPRDLAPLPGTRTERTVWVQQLMLFDPATGKGTAITSGVTNNLDASMCSR